VFEGVLIDISTNENRALYVGISGALNIVTALLPLIIGIIVKFIGFTVVLSLVSLMLFTSIIFLKKINISDNNI
jgi:hypothetical protein